MGRRDEALEAIQQAVEIWKVLATEHPPSFNQELAICLSNFATHPLRYE